MVDRVSLSKLIDYILRTDRRTTGERNRTEEREDIKVSLSRATQILESTKPEEEEDTKKVEEIKEQIRKGEYKVSEEKIKEGLERFFL
ncbi:flagellar biosynthesis anti-sigma factor FlgM [Aquifex sp.]